jgi:DUF4097 and DUF4098 domain-containing protein YvlB
MKPRYYALLAALSLTGCVDGGSFSSHNVEVRFHRALPAAGATQLSVANVSGSIAVTAWDQPNVDVSAVIYGADKDAVARTHVTASRNDTQIEVKTDYDNGGSFFGSHNGGEVDYTIRAPKSIAVSVTNVSGPTTLIGLAGNVDANEVSGRLDASLGTLTGTRSVHMTAISGRITVHIKRNSDARVNASTLSGDVNLFFPSDSHEGTVGNSATGQIGKGTSTMTLHTVSGPIAVEPE